jgi:hypothetical protein
LNSLGWNEYFEEVFSLDYFIPSLNNKSELLSKLMIDFHEDISQLMLLVLF